MSDDGAVGVRCPVFVGRDAELGALRARLAGALGGCGGFVMVRAAAGSGKSRLCRELVDGVRDGGALVTVGRAVPLGASAPYRPLAEAVLRAVRRRGVPAGEPELARWLPALEPVVPLPGLPPSGHLSSGGSPALRGEAMLRLLGWLGSGHGLLVVLEDLHWADPGTLDVVEYLAGNLGGEPVLCVGTLLRGAPPSRASELAGRLGGRGSASLIDLGALEARRSGRSSARPPRAPRVRSSRGSGGSRRACRSWRRSCPGRPGCRARSPRRCAPGSGCSSRPGSMCSSPPRCSAAAWTGLLITRDVIDLDELLLPHDHQVVVQPEPAEREH